MGAAPLIDDHVLAAQCSKALAALHAHAASARDQRDAGELLPSRDEHVWLVVGTKQMHPEKKLKPHRIPLKHPLIDPRETSICLFTKDPQREYKELLADKNINFVSRVVGVTKLKGKFRGFDARRALLNESGLFLADERIIPLLPKLLGSKFFQAKKQPIPVSLTSNQLKVELERAVSSTYFHQNKGTCTAVKIGPVSESFGAAKLLDNLATALPAVVAAVKGGWDNIQNLHVKTSSSVALPIWTCELGADKGGRWDGLTLDAADTATATNGVAVGQKRSKREEDTENSESAGQDRPAPKASKSSKGTSKAVGEQPEPPKKKRKHDGPAQTTPVAITERPTSVSTKAEKPKQLASPTSTKPTSTTSTALKSAFKSSGSKPSSAGGKKKTTFASDVDVMAAEDRPMKSSQTKAGSNKKDKIIGSTTRDKERKKATLVSSAKRR